jgi:UDP-N-acetylglucosamine--N-acetylmuramyl-(pentapeptide) pyrophosphoryl-undecaprenol N-acetylglucosamine transferase
MAAAKKISTFIQEQNSFPGITNKILAKHAEKIFVAYNEMEKYFPKSKIIVTGNPVRKNIVDITGKRKEAATFFGLDPDKKTLLVVGGSLGALSINESIRKNLGFINDSGLQLIWQTGKYYFETAKKTVDTPLEYKIKVHDFIKEMDFAYAMADIVISRAGAIAISELCLVGKPVIFIPLPSAAEDHQAKNAMELVKNNAALMIRDDKASKEIYKALEELVNDTEKRELLSSNIKKLAFSNAAEKIADKIVETLEKK